MQTPVLKKSKQRDAILSNIKNRYDHPTADMIYMDLRQEFPRISLGTVYRNLSLLADLGEIIRVDSNGKSEHFDGNTNYHAHFVCTKCNQIYDFPDLPSLDLSKIRQEASFPGKINSYSLTCYGVCKHCEDA